MSLSGAPSDLLPQRKYKLTIYRSITPRLHIDLIDIEQELFELPQKVNIFQTNHFYYTTEQNTR